MIDIYDDLREPHRKGRAMISQGAFLGQAGAPLQFEESVRSSKGSCVPAPPELVGKTLAEARLPQILGSLVIEIKRQGPLGEEPVIPTAETKLLEGDLLLLLGPTAKLEALSQGSLADEALAQHQAKSE